MHVDRRQTQLNDDFAAVDLHQMRLARRYSDWIVQQIRPHCGKRILEVGAGIGNISSRLLRDTDYLCACEPNPTCFEALRRSLGGLPGFECRPWRIEDCDVPFVVSRRIDTIVCVNVLEHLEDDVQALKRLRAMLPDDGAGRIVLLVPARAFSPSM
jgi:2-polyprenyl-3-methyl-5-hydroxy-6-metoxy-1,4-benzoquinol methylase